DPHPLSPKAAAGQVVMRRIHRIEALSSLRPSVDEARRPRDAAVMKHTVLFLLAALTLVLSLGGCAATRGGAAKDDPLARQTEALETLDPNRLIILDGAEGAPIGWSELVARAAEADVVIIG